jgi:hypothetical protein
VPPKLTKLVPWGRRIAPPDVAFNKWPHRESVRESLPALWPLTRSPTLAPHAPLDSIYGTASLPKLCAERGHARRVDGDVALAYLAAWCSGDHRRVLAQVDAFLKSSGRVFADAARADAIDLLVATHGAEAAIAWLDARSLGDSSQLDRLAATYRAYDREHDALVANRRAAVRGVHDSAAIRCRRALVGEELGANVFDEVHGNPDPLCQPPVGPRCPLVKGAAWGTCHGKGCEIEVIENDLARCEQFLAAHPELSVTAYLVTARVHWPHYANEPATWLGYAQLAARGIELEPSPLLVLAALENAALVSDCTEPVRREISAITRSLLRAPDAEIAARVARLVRLTWDDCYAMRRETLHP